MIDYQHATSYNNAVIEYIDLIGKPFRYGARGPDEYDCYGLVTECFSRMGKEIPDYKSPTVLKEIAELVASEKYRWTPIAKKSSGELIPANVLTPGRLIEIRVKGLACHVGFIHKPRKFLHTWEDTGGVAQNELSDWREKILGVYEYAA